MFRVMTTFQRFCISIASMAPIAVALQGNCECGTCWQAERCLVISIVWTDDFGSYMPSDQEDDLLRILLLFYFLSQIELI